MKRIVIKVGSSTLTYETGRLNLRRIELLSRTLADLHNSGMEVILVTSGAVAVGMSKLGITSASGIGVKQASAAVGQCELMHIYDKLFGEYGCNVAQILLTGDDVADEVRRKNLELTFNSLLEMRTIPIVNENDSVEVAEIEHIAVLGDNDTLSAIVADLTGADLLVLLTDTDGLYDSDPRKNPDAHIISVVEEITPEIELMAGGAGTSRGTGGFATKLRAAKIATAAGVEMAIINGASPDKISRVVAGDRIGTRFLAKK